MSSPATHNTEVLIFDDISTQNHFLELAKSMGRPIKNSEACYIDSLKVVDQAEAKKNTLSSRYGNGAFPFHTDTAFWNLPARIVLLRAVKGDLSRQTILRPFAPLLGLIGISTIRQSAWICDTGTRKLFTTMEFESETQHGFRYDPNCMKPANKAAHAVEKALKSDLMKNDNKFIEWIPNRVTVIPNWTYLHARGTSSQINQARILERIYIS